MLFRSWKINVGGVFKTPAAMVSSSAMASERRLASSAEAKSAAESTHDLAWRQASSRVPGSCQIQREQELSHRKTRGE